MNKALILTLGMMLLLVGVVYGIQPTQQFNKIYLTPFYRESLSSNTNYTFTVSINPPDKITSVIGAIISYNAQINGQSQNFSIWVNGRACNTPSYYIATAFSTTGNMQFSFDCSKDRKSVV